MFTPTEWDLIIRGAYILVLVAVAVLLYRYDRRDRRLATLVKEFAKLKATVEAIDADQAVLWDATFGPPPDDAHTSPIKAQPPAADGPVTAEAHPADTFARKEFVQAQKTSGRHRK